MQALRTDDFASPSCLPAHFTGIIPPEGLDLADVYELPTVSLPPELYDIDEDRWQVGEGQVGNLQLFAEEVSFYLELS